MHFGTPLAFRDRVVMATLSCILILTVLAFIARLTSVSGMALLVLFSLIGICPVKCSDNLRLQWSKGNPSKSTGRSYGCWLPTDTSFCDGQICWLTKFVRFLCIITTLQVCRIGEASNPGPDTLILRSCNPTTVAFKEDIFTEMEFSVLGVSETAATSKVQNILQNQLAKKNIKSKWSAPVPPFAFSASNMRGLAGGSAIFSPLLVRNTCEMHPDDISHSTRYCETHVQYQPHRFLFCANLYGPTDGFRYADPILTMNRLFNYAAQRALRFVGPATIMGDFNRPLCQLEAWPMLQANGWVDTAVLSSAMHGNELDLTSSVDILF